MWEERAEFVHSTVKGAIILSLGGAGLLLLLRRWEWALGLFLGGLASLANFQLIAQAVATMMEPHGSQRPKHLWKGPLFRLLLMGLFLFLVVRFLRANLIALAIGLLAVQASIIGLLLIKGR